MNMTVTYHVYFGLSIPDNSSTERAHFSYPVVSPSEWADFLYRTIQPRLPAFTITDALGCWNGSFEETKILTVTAAEFKARTYETLVEIAQQYKEKYHQQSVMINHYSSHTFSV